MPLTPTPPSGEWRFSCRPIGAQLLASFFPVAAVAIGFAVGEALIGTTGTDRAALGAPAIVLVGAILIRARRIGVWATPDRVVIQNLWTTHVLNWDDVARIDPEGASMVIGRWWLFRMRDGRAVLARALPFWAPDEKTQELARSATSPVEYGRLSR